MRVDSRLWPHTFLLQKLIMRQSYLTACRSGSEPSHGVLLSLADNLESVDQFMGGFAQDDRAGKLGIKATKAVVLDEKRHVISRLDGAALKVSLREERRAAESCRHAEKNSLFAPQELAFILRQSSHLQVTHT